MHIFIYFCVPVCGGALSHRKSSKSWRCRIELLSLVALWKASTTISVMTWQATRQHLIFMRSFCGPIRHCGVCTANPSSRQAALGCVRRYVWMDMTSAGFKSWVAHEQWTDLFRAPVCTAGRTGGEGGQLLAQLKWTQFSVWRETSLSPVVAPKAMGAPGPASAWAEVDTPQRGSTLDGLLSSIYVKNASLPPKCWKYWLLTLF